MALHNWPLGWRPRLSSLGRVDGEEWSGRVDLNHRPPGPEPGALTRLSHAPNFIPYFTAVYAESNSRATARRETRRSCWAGCTSKFPSFKGSVALTGLWEWGEPNFGTMIGTRVAEEL